MQPKIGPLGKKDAKEFSGLARRIISATDYYSKTAKEHECKNYNAEKVLEKLLGRKYLHLCAKLGGKMVGFLDGYFDLGVFWVDWIGVERGFRRKGIATEMLKFLEKKLKRGKAHKVWFDSRTNNRESIGLFRKMGYKKIAFLKNHWYGQDFYLWEKFI